MRNVKVHICYGFLREPLGDGEPLENTRGRFSCVNDSKDISHNRTVPLCSEIAPEGLRERKTTNGETVEYTTDLNGRVVLENDEYIINGNTPLAVKRGDSYYYYICNGHGDVVMLIDEQGNVMNTYSYDPWGKITAQTEAVDNNIKYAGEYYDDENGLIYLRNRYYDPNIRRFTSEDPARDGLNWYAYCENNPVMFVDPLGLDSYIFYVRSISVDDRNKTTLDEAKIWQEKMETKYGTPAYYVEVTSTEQFTELWSMMSKLSDNDAVVIIGHGIVDNVDGEGVGYIKMPNGKFYAKDNKNETASDRSADDLEKATMKELIFSTCNSGNPDIYNLAYGFKINNNITEQIIAWDGGTVFDYSKQDNVRGGGKNYFWQSWKDEQRHQETWWYWVDKDSEELPVRTRIGKRSISGQ